MTIFSSSLNVKVTGSMPISFIENWFYRSKVKVINQVKVIPRSNFKCFYWQARGGPPTERHSSWMIDQIKNHCNFQDNMPFLYTGARRFWKFRIQTFIRCLLCNIFEPCVVLLFYVTQNILAQREILGLLEFLLLC